MLYSRLLDVVTLCWSGSKGVLQNLTRLDLYLYESRDLELFIARSHGWNIIGQWHDAVRRLSWLVARLVHVAYSVERDHYECTCWICTVAETGWSSSERENRSWAWLRRFEVRPGAAAFPLGLPNLIPLVEVRVADLFITG